MVQTTVHGDDSETRGRKTMPSQKIDCLPARVVTRLLQQYLDLGSWPAANERERNTP